MLAMNVARMPVVTAMATKPKTAMKKPTFTKPKGAALSGPDRTLWRPDAEAPEWLDGTLPGDAGFDPLSLSKPTEYLQFDVDSLDMNKPKNRAGQLLGKIKPTDNGPKEDALVPYTEVFDILRFRECEVIHGRWAMLAALGAIAAEAATGVNWVDAGKVELEQGSSYFGLGLPFDVTQLTIIEVLLVGGAEVLRNGQLDQDKRVYPGGAFDPLGLAGDDKEAEAVFALKVAELKHGRLAMVAFFGYAAAAGKSGSGSLFDALS